MAYATESLRLQHRNLLHASFPLFKVQLQINKIYFTKYKQVIRNHFVLLLVFVSVASTGAAAAAELEVWVGFTLVVDSTAIVTTSYMVVVGRKMSFKFVSEVRLLGQMVIR